MAKARSYYYVSNKRVQNTKKKQQAEKQYEVLLKREAEEGSTNWIKAEKEKAEKKLRKYGSAVLRQAPEAPKAAPKKKAAAKPAASKEAVTA